jgi:hypothetical protein
MKTSTRLYRALVSRSRLQQKLLLLPRLLKLRLKPRLLLMQQLRLKKRSPKHPQQLRHQLHLRRLRQRPLLLRLEHLLRLLRMDAGPALHPLRADLRQSVESSCRSCRVPDLVDAS